MHSTREPASEDGPDVPSGAVDLTDELIESVRRIVHDGGVQDYTWNYYGLDMKQYEEKCGSNRRHTVLLWPGGQGQVDHAYNLPCRRARCPRLCGWEGYVYPAIVAMSEQMGSGPITVVHVANDSAYDALRRQISRDKKNYLAVHWADGSHWVFTDTLPRFKKHSPMLNVLVSPTLALYLFAVAAQLLKAQTNKPYSAGGTWVHGHEKVWAEKEYSDTSPPRTWSFTGSFERHMRSLKREAARHGIKIAFSYDMVTVPGYVNWEGWLFMLATAIKRYGEGKIPDDILDDINAAYPVKVA